MDTATNNNAANEGHAMANTEIKIGMTVWGPKHSYLGTVVKIRYNVSHAFATVRWGDNIGLGQEEVSNVNRLEAFEE